MRTTLMIATLLFATPAFAEQVNGLPPAGTPVAIPADGVPSLADTLIETVYSNMPPQMPTLPRANANEPPLPPSPPPVTYDVWVYKWDGQQFIKQDNYTLQTTDIRQAAIYWNQCNAFAGWAARANTPDTCIAHIISHDPTSTTDMGRASEYGRAHGCSGRGVN